jgi:hypothetical protein
MGQEQELADRLFGQGQQQKSMGALEALKETFQSVLDSQFVKDVGNEFDHQIGAGAHELAAALFNGSAFVMYPRGTKEDPGVHGPEAQGQDVQEVQQPPPQIERGGIEL